MRRNDGNTGRQRVSVIDGAGVGKSPFLPKLFLLPLHFFQAQLIGLPGFFLLGGADVGLKRGGQRFSCEGWDFPAFGKVENHRVGSRMTI